MTIVRSFTNAVDAISRNPIVLAVAMALALLQAPSLLASRLDPATGSIVSLVASGATVLVTPFVFAGGIAISGEALDGDTDVGAFLAAGRRHYLRVLGAYLLVAVGVGLLAFGGTIVGGILAVAAAAGGVPVGGLLAGLLTVGLVLLPVFFLQFFAHAIVLDEHGIADGLRRSVGVVRRNLLTVAGYSLVLFGLSIVAGLVGAIGSLVNAPGIDAFGLQPLSPAVVTGLQVIGVLATGVVTAVFWPFSVAVYRQLRDRTVSEDGTDRPTPA